MVRCKVDFMLRLLDPLLHQLLTPPPHTERRRIGLHATAVGLVAAATVMRFVFGLTAIGQPVALLHAAVFLSSVLGGMSSALVAALASVLVLRIDAGAGGAASAMFFAEALGIAALAAAGVQRLRAQQQQLSSADDRI